jgi:hypothetical protein
MSILTGETDTGEVLETTGTTADEVVETAGTEEPTRPGWIDQLLPKHKDNADLVKEMSQYEKIDDLVTALQERAAVPELDVQNASEYELPAVEYPEGMEADPSAEEFFRSLVFDMKISKEAAAGAWQKFNEWTVGRLNEAIEAESEMQKKADESLKRIWGNVYPKNIEIVRRHMTETATPELLARIDDSGLGNDPEFIKWVHKQAAGFGEDTAVMGTTPKKEKDIVDTFFPQEKSHITKGRKTY